MFYSSPCLHYLTFFFCSNRKPSLRWLPLLFGPTPEECMPVWAAARCTSAAFPYFKPLEWQGQMLFDGGFKLDCPAACANSEAKSIWPRKHCDILLSLGSGTTSNLSSSASHRLFRVFRAIADISDSQTAWERFLGETLQKRNLFRLNPSYGGTRFELDSVRKLNEIENQTERWIATQNDGANQHMRSPHCRRFFFFRPIGPDE